jgi:hypothetical protein
MLNLMAVASAKDLDLGSPWPNYSLLEFPSD